MLCTKAPQPQTVEETRIPLEQLDETTLRALCDGGYLDHAEYVAIARARGVLIAETAKPVTSGRPESAFVIMLPEGCRLLDLLAALRPLGGRVLAAIDCPALGAKTFPALDTRMQHHPRRESPIISIA